MEAVKNPYLIEAFKMFDAILEVNLLSGLKGRMMMLDEPDDNNTITERSKEVEEQQQESDTPRNEVDQGDIFMPPSVLDKFREHFAEI